MENQRRPLGIIIAAVLMIIFGLAEVATGFTHKFFVISTSSSTLFTLASTAIGAFYIVSGLLILTMKKWAALLAILLLCADIAGRIALVMEGLYPLSSPTQTFAIVAGTIIAALFAIYILWKWKLYG